MKFFRFIRNLWRGFLGLFGGADFKDFLKEIGVYALAGVGTMGLAWAAGHFARWINVAHYLPIAKQEDTLAIGSCFLALTFCGILLLGLLFIIALTFKKVWDES